MDRSEIVAYVESEFSRDQNKLRVAVTHAILAIGVQCRAGRLDDKQCDGFHFAEAQRTAFENMLVEPSTDLARLFLLLAFYLLGSSRRNAAFMYIGVSVRAAQSLGLHNEQSYRSAPANERLSR